MALSHEIQATKSAQINMRSGLSDVASEVLKHFQPKPFDWLQLVVVHSSQTIFEPGLNPEPYFIRYFSFDDRIWDGEHGWIHDGIHEEVGPAAPHARHMIVDLCLGSTALTSGAASIAPFRAPVAWDEEDNADTYDWAHFARSSFHRVDAADRPLTVCSSITHVLTIINITHSMDPS